VCACSQHAGPLITLNHAEPIICLYAKFTSVNPSSTFGVRAENKTPQAPSELGNGRGASPPVVISSPSGARGRAPTEHEFGAFLASRNTSAVGTIEYSKQGSENIFVFFSAFPLI